jgi:hypothetical protein
MHETLWYLIVGAVLMGMGVATSALRHLPCSSAMIYLALGIALGPAGGAASISTSNAARRCCAKSSRSRCWCRCSRSACGCACRCPTSCGWYRAASACSR